MKSKLSIIAPIITCSLLVGSLSQILFKTISLSLPFIATTIVAFISSVVLYLLISNKKLLLISIVSLVVLIPLIWLLLKSNQKEIVTNFLNSCSDFLKDGTTISLQYQRILGYIIVFIITLIMIIPTIIIPIFPVISSFCIVAIIYQWRLFGTEILVESCIILGSLIVFFSYSFINNKKHNKIIRSSIVIWLIPICVIVMLIVGSDIKNPRQDRKWDWLEIRANILSDYIADYTGKASNRNLFSISNAGYEPLVNRLGGPITLSTKDIMKVFTKKSILLRGAIKNNYTGDYWLDDIESYRYRFSNQNEVIKNEIFSLALPNEDIKDSNYHEEIEIQVIPLVDSSSTIFVPNRTVDVIPDKMLTMLPYFNSIGEAFSSRDISSGIGYTIKADMLLYEEDDFGDYISSIEQNNYIDTDYTNMIYDNYTSLPDNLPQSVRDKALELTQRFPSDYAKAKAITNYLENNFRYTLSPIIPPESSDFVEHFLETKKGYCTYYASAIAVMARCAGLPSRYVEGFSVKPANGKKETIVTAENAHAWAEIYIRGIGWLPFDPKTSTRVSSSGEIPDSFDEEMFVQEPTPEVVEDVAPIELKDKISPLPIILTVFVGLLLLIFGFIIIMHNVRINISLQRKRYQTNRKIVTINYLDILFILKYYGPEKPPSQTISSYAKIVDNWLRFKNYNFKEIANIISKMVYEEKEITDKDVDYIYSYYQVLRYYTARKLGRIRYFIIITKLLLNSLHID